MNILGNDASEFIVLDGQPFVFFIRDGFGEIYAEQQRPDACSQGTCHQSPHRRDLP